MAVPQIPAWLKSEHDIWAFNKAKWEHNEICLRGGDEVLSFLRPFDWETLPEYGTHAFQYPATSNMLLRMAGEGMVTTPGEHFHFRQMMATYLPFPEMFSTTLVGHLMRQRPVPGTDLDFGGLVKVRRTFDKNNPTKAEIIYFNCDGIGNDGSQWDNYWAGVVRRTLATGHRWIYVDAPAARAASRGEALRLGLHPYVTDYSPTQVTQWHYEGGTLAFAIVKVANRIFKYDEDADELTDRTDDAYLVLVRGGYAGLGSKYSSGGWWKLDPDGKQIAKGNWNRTGGAIPFFPMYYQRDYPTQDRPVMSKPGTSEMSNAAISYMNISSAADFDAWDAAASIQFLRGVDEDGFKLAMTKLKEGSRYVPLPANMEIEGTLSPMAQDGSMGAVTAQVFDLALKRKLDEVARLAATQAVSAPDSSGLSKSAGFSEAKVPRLALMASELEQAQNTALYYLERRYGVQNPAAQVAWTRKFDLIDLSDEIKSFFEIEALTGLRSSILQSKGLIRAARDKSMITDDQTATEAEAEYKQQAEQMIKLAVAPPTPVTSNPSERGIKGAEPAAKAILSGGSE
jgi:hypothetical protein